MAARRSCSLLSPDEMLEGKVPTNSTTASIIAGVQVQEATKLLVGREDLLALRNAGFFYTGDTLDSYVMGYTEDEWCVSHDAYGPLESLPVPTDATLADLVTTVAAQNGPVDAVDFEAEMITARRCTACGWADGTIRPLSSFGHGDGLCPACGVQLSLTAGLSFAPDEDITTRPLTELQLPDLDVVTLRSGQCRRHFIVRSRA